MGTSSSKPEAIARAASSPPPDYSGVNFLDQDGHVRRVVCLLENLKDIDIIVNSTDKSLRLTSGGDVSNTILRIGGQDIQDELNNDYPNGIETYEIAVSEGHDLPYSYVYHCSLQNINKRISHHLIREVVQKCLETASTNNHGDTIAFPAIGTGSMNFPPRILRTIYRAILEFTEEYPNDLTAGYIIIHPKMTDLIKYIKTIDPNEELQRLTYPVDFSGWSQTDEIRRVDLSTYDDKYVYIAGKFKETMRRSSNILQIQRIENKRLYIPYERYRNSLPQDQQEAKHLWHGTKESSVSGIIRYGFDWRLTERAVYGQGCYFAKEAWYSDQDSYSVPNSDGEKFMFLAYVSVGNAIIGSSNITEGNIPSNEQTTVNDLSNPTIFVTYDDDQPYPAFLIKYEL